MPGISKSIQEHHVLTAVRKYTTIMCIFSRNCFFILTNASHSGYSCCVTGPTSGTPSSSVTPSSSSSSASRRRLLGHALLLLLLLLLTTTTTSTTPQAQPPPPPPHPPLHDDDDGRGWVVATSGAAVERFAKDDLRGAIAGREHSQVGSEAP